MYQQMTCLAVWIINEENHCRLVVLAIPYSMMPFTDFNEAVTAISAPFRPTSQGLASLRS